MVGAALLAAPSLPGRKDLPPFTRRTQSRSIRLAQANQDGKDCSLVSDMPASVPHFWYFVEKNNGQ